MRLTNLGRTEVTHRGRNDGAITKLEMLCRNRGNKRWGDAYSENNKNVEEVDLAKISDTEENEAALETNFQKKILKRYMRKHFTTFIWANRRQLGNGTTSQIKHQQTVVQLHSKFENFNSRLLSWPGKEPNVSIYKGCKKEDQMSKRTCFNKNQKDVDHQLWNITIVPEDLCLPVFNSLHFWHSK